MHIEKVVYEGVTYIGIDSENTSLPTSIIQQALLDQAWGLVRDQRDRLLRDCDYAVMPDYPLTDAQKADVTAYRQALRDIPATFDSPEAVEWPAKPETLTQ